MQFETIRRVLFTLDGIQNSLHATEAVSAASRRCTGASSSNWITFKGVNGGLCNESRVHFVFYNTIIPLIYLINTFSVLAVLFFQFK